LCVFYIDTVHVVIHLDGTNLADALPGKKFRRIAAREQVCSAAADFLFEVRLRIYSEVFPVQ